MFNLNVKKENKFISYINEHALWEFRDGKYKYMNELYKVFTIKNEKNLQKEIAKVFIEILSDKTVKQLIQLDERCRSYAYLCIYLEDGIEGYKPDWKKFKFARDDFKHLTEEEYIAVLRMGTYHISGFVRQMCMEYLEKYENNLLFYLIRVNDWVSDIRNMAYLLSIKEVEVDDVTVLLKSLLVIDKVIKSGRRELEHIYELDKAVKINIEKKIIGCPMEVIFECDVNIRNMFYKFLNDTNIFSLDYLKKLLSMEKTGYGKKLIIQNIFNNYNIEMDDVDNFLKSKNTIIRFMALEYKYQMVKNSWDGLEAMLMDKSKKIRDSASFILLRNTKFNILDFYKEQLKIKENSIAILGIVEQGKSEDVQIILQYLKSESVVIIKNVLKAYGMLVGDKGSDLYWEYLHHPSALIYMEAFRLIKKHNVQYDGKQLFEEYEKYYDLI